MGVDKEAKAKRDAARRKHLLANGLCTQCGKESLAIHSTNKGLNCLASQAAAKKRTRKDWTQQARVIKKEIIKSVNRWSIINSPLYQCW